MTRPRSHPLLRHEAPEARAAAGRCPHVPFARFIAPLSLLALSCTQTDGGEPPAPSGPASVVIKSASIIPLPEKAAPAEDLRDGGAPHDEDAGGADAQGGVIHAGGTAPASSAEPAEPPPPCPEEMALIGQFCVDRYEAHLAVDAPGGLSVHPYFKRLEPGVRYLARSAPGVFPQAYISRVESQAACEASGKRLCTRREWMRACQNKGTETYPYGPLGQRKRCNTGKLHLLTEMFGTHPRGGFKYEEHFNSPDLNQTPGFLARGGEFEGCVSDREVYDMVGNLHEWVSDTVTQDLMDKLEAEEVERREQPWGEGNGVFMGGFYSTTSELGPGCFYTTVAHEPRYHDYSTGFRCCTSARLPPSPVVPASSKKKSRSAG